uniref:Uncharacterized protein n=1 Tax=Arundo donax TaxID=35708 RepID=A0A0A9ARG5_ARUDO
MLRPGRGEVDVLRDVRRRRGRGGGRALPVMDAQRDAPLAGVRRPGQAHPVPVLLEN